MPMTRPGSHSVTIMRSFVRNGPIRVTAVERRADAAVLLARERDRLGVGHPVDVRLDRLDRRAHTSSGGASIDDADA